MVINYYRIEIGLTGIVTAVRLLYLILAFRAYKIAYKDYE